MEPFCSKETEVLTLESPHFYAGNIFVYSLFLKAHLIQFNKPGSETSAKLIFFLKKISYCVVRTGKVSQSTISEGNQCCPCSSCDSHHFNANNRHNNCPQQTRITIDGYLYERCKFISGLRWFFQGSVWLYSTEIRIVKVHLSLCQKCRKHSSLPLHNFFLFYFSFT